MSDSVLSEPGLIVGSLILGLLVGSFLNVVIYRLPLMLQRQWREQCAQLAAEADSAAATTPATLERGAPSEERYSLLVPRSACTTCNTPIKAWHNIPLLSYLWLKGRCASCGASIGVRYPIVELLTGLASAAVAWKFGWQWQTVAALVFTWFLVALTFIDVDHQLLPDNLTLPLLWIGLLLSLWAATEGAGAVIPADIRSSVIGAVAGYLSLWSVYHLFRLATGKEGMGYGDFKLFAALGAWFGWQMLLPIILISAVVGAVVGIVMLAVQGRSRATPIPFGPFLAASGWLMLFFGQDFAARYLGT